MEAWKTGDPLLLQHPVAALSACTLRWSLEPFPSNLVAASDFESWPNRTYYPCGSNLGQLCSASPSCTSESCLILIDNTGRATVGPANTSIVGLTHGIIILIFVILTSVIIASSGIMGLLKKLRRKAPPAAAPPAQPSVRPPAPPQPGDPLHHTMAQYYTPPTPRTVRRAELPTAHWDKAAEVARVSGLLRDMYQLDLSAWTMQNSSFERDLRRTSEMQARADALFAEVKRSVGEWEAEGRKWSEEEMGEIRAIKEFVEGVPAGRYQ